MTIETTVGAPADIMQLTDDEIDAVGGGWWFLIPIAVAVAAVVLLHQLDPKGGYLL